MGPSEMIEGRSRETKIRRDAQGRWWNDDLPIEHVLLTQAFDAWIERAEDGRYRLKNDINWAYVTIEGAPVFVRSVALDDVGVTLRLSDGRVERLDASTLREGPDGALYCTVREGTLAARFDAHASMQLEPILLEDERGPFLALGGGRIRPPLAGDPISWPA